jgi:heat-inducible transcriptional repressor
MARRSQKPVENSELDARKAAILDAVVVEHINSAAPVGSSTVASAAHLDVSSATVRSEMVALEREGYLVQPHTSAGRVPTDKGYRYFVDHLGHGQLGAVQQAEVRNFFGSVRGEVETILEQTSNLLARLTRYPSVVVGSTPTTASIIRTQLVALEPRHQLLVVIFSDGTVVKHAVDTDYDVSHVDVMEASAQLDALLIGTTLASKVQVPSRTNLVAQLVQKCVAILHAQSPSREGEQLFVGGSSQVAEVFDNVETVRTILSVLEQELLVVSLVEEMLDRGASVTIGTEHRIEPLANASVVVAPVIVDGDAVGAVGLIGPTRMKYQEAMAAAEVVSRELTKHLGGES